MELYYPNRPPQQPPKSIISKSRERTDAALGLWHTHDPAIYKEEESGYYYIYCTGAICQRSTDLIHWKMVGKVVEAPPEESSQWVGSNDIWAPDIQKVGNEYRLYCSNSTWGVRQSCIFLAVSDNPEGPFVPRGCVLKTSDDYPVNAIDANIITDAKTKETYLIYGSFWGGCHAILLDNETGLAAEEGIGVCLAKRPAWMSGAIEGPYMVYHPETEYYYLFVSYGSLKTDYQIRVGRSRNITGPFLDFHGKSLVAEEDEENEIGLLLFGGYRWTDGLAYMAPGHNSVLKDSDGNWYMVCHIREWNYKKEGEPSTMQVRRIYWSEDGWPIVSAEPYCGEKIQDVPEEMLVGNYERIRFGNSLPQGITEAVPMKLLENGEFECCSIQGKWKKSEKKITITYGPHSEEVFVIPAWDTERQCPAITLCGISNHGTTFWAKKCN